MQEKIIVILILFWSSKIIITEKIKYFIVLMWC